MGGTIAQLPIGQQVSLLGYFGCPVVPEAARPFAKSYECRGRLPDNFRQSALVACEHVHLISWIAAKPARTT